MSPLKKKKAVARPKKKTAKAKKAPAQPAQKVDSKSYTFFQNVYEVARLVPKGRVTSYGAIAKYLGSGRSARLVGYAMNDSHRQRPKVPAHRVINRNGLLTGRHHFNPPELMQQLLEKEGLKVKNNVVLNFKAVFWDPQTELAI